MIGFFSRFGCCSSLFKRVLFSVTMSGRPIACGKPLQSIFKGVWDAFQGVSVSSADEPRTEVDFKESLQNSLTQWKENKVRAVWMKVYLEHSYWIPVLAESGFTYHHAKPNYVTMVKWLPEEEPNNIPTFAHNTVGVGGFVVNEEQELLVVRERFRKTRHWKLPGGYVEPGEDLTVAVTREVKEETGVDTEFESLLAFRHTHGANFGCSDLYFIVVLKPKSHVITMCKYELADCRWMKLNEYIDHPDVHQTNKFFAKCYLEKQVHDVHIKASQSKVYYYNVPKDQIIYHMQSANDAKIGISNNIPSLTNSDHSANSNNEEISGNKM